MDCKKLDREQLLSYLFSLTSQGIKYDLDRIRDAVRVTGEPQLAIPSVHVAGTNGKGSVSAMVASVLKCAGYHTGLYMSPHLIAFEERFLIDGVPAATNDWLAVYRDCADVCEHFELTFFEIATLVAFELFRRAGVAWGVFETGLGGRLDATNILVPRVSIITGIAMDHREYLGETIDAIAGEKLGIIKPGVPAVIYRSPHPNFESAARAVCRDRNAPIHLVSERDARDITCVDGRFQFTLDGQRYCPGMRGRFQVANAVCAIRACQVTGIADSAVIAQGISQTVLPGRYQKVQVRDKTVIFDVGHNPGGARVTALSLREEYDSRDVVIVVGIMKDKDCAGILAELAPVAAHLYLCAPTTERAARPRDLLTMVPSDIAGEIDTCDTVDSAVSRALAGPQPVVCVAGSFYTVGEAMVFLKVQPRFA